MPMHYGLRHGLCLCLLFAVAAVWSSDVTAAEPRHYALAFASYAPNNADIFIADADGGNARPLVTHPDLDYNPTLSRDGNWVVFTSTRGGSADIYRVHADGSGLEKLTNDPAFDDQGMLSPNGQWLAFVSDRSGRANIWVLELATGVVRNVTHDDAGDFRPSWSADGQWIAFSSDRDSKRPKFNFVTLQSTEIYVMRADGSGLRQITHGEAFAGSPSWSADGKSIVYYEADFTSVDRITNPRGPARGTTQIVNIDLASNTRSVLTTGPGEKWSPHRLSDGRVAYVSGEGGVEFVSGAAGARGEMRSPSWSGDGRRMVFHRDVEGAAATMRPWPGRDSNLRLVRTPFFPSFAPAGDQFVSNSSVPANSITLTKADGNSSVLFADPKAMALAPAWAPRGDQIAFGLGGYFQAMAGPATADIVTMGADGTNVQRLTNGTGNYGFPGWSPDGKRIVFRAASEDDNGLRVVDTATRAVTALTTGHDNFPSWSPKGDRIAFTSDRDGDYEIYTIKPDGTNMQRLTNVPGNDAHSAWSPDGEWIAFTSARGGFRDESVLHPNNPQSYADIYVMRANGTDVRRVTDNQFEEGSPAWIAAEPRAASKGPPLYVVQRGAAKVYLLGGTVDHPEKWLGARIRAALLEAKELWQENPSTPFADNETLRKQLSERTSGSLFDDLSPQEAQRVLAAAQKLGIKREQLEHLRPWAAGSVFSVALFFVQAKSTVGEAGKPQPGLGDLATAQGIPIRSEIPTWDDFSRFFAGLSLPAQRQYLMSVVDQAAAPSEMEEMQRLDQAWMEGRTKDYESVRAAKLAQERKQYPDLYAATELARNQAWVMRIDRMLAAGGVYFINVGVNHTIGPDSIQNLLEKHGLRVKRL